MPHVGKCYLFIRKYFRTFFLKTSLIQYHRLDPDPVYFQEHFRTLPKLDRIYIQYQYCIMVLEEELLIKDPL
jgi:hypothetical protein